LVSQGVAPSGADLATACALMAPLAPGRLSTITDWPSSTAKPWARILATKSTGPPGGKAMTILIGAAPCANTAPANTISEPSSIDASFFMLCALKTNNHGGQM